MAHDPLSRRTLMYRLGAGLLLPVLSGCGGSDDAGAGAGDAGDLTLKSAGGGDLLSKASTGSFSHPGVAHSAADFTRMKTQVDNGVSPWTSGWSALTSSGRAQLGRAPEPLVTVIRGGEGENFRAIVEDVQRAYQFALCWKVSGDTRYADAAVAYLDAWSSTMTTLTGNSDRFLAAGLYGYQWAMAGEMMRGYAGWSSAGLAAMQQLLLAEFQSKCSDFLDNHNGSNITNYWANWDLIALCGQMAIGIFCDRRDIYNKALDYYLNGRGNGAADHSVYCIHPGYLGQWQELARDNGHATLSVGLSGLLCEMAWQQGDDLYSHRNNRLLAGAEYVAKAQLTDSNGVYYTLPFSRYVNRQGTFTQVSESGRPHLRAIWECIYNHYANRKGLSAPYARRMAERVRPERNEWGGDMPSFGTLTFSLPPASAAVAPSGLTAYVTDGEVLLSWWGSAVATSYLVQRSASANGSFTTLATLGSDDTRTWTDNPGAGQWYYRVCTVHGGQTLVGTDRARVHLAGELRLDMTLNQTSGTSAIDTSGGARHGSLMGNASWTPGHVAGHAVAFNGSTGHLALSKGVVEDLGDFTIALWVHWNTAVTNTRIFDFGSGDIAYMCLIPRDGNGVMSFRVTGTTYFGEQVISHTAPLSTGTWVHVAVTLKGRVGTLYVNGTAVGSNAEIDLAPFQLGSTHQNWLGRSQYPTDPYFNGKMQDLEIYSGALADSEMASLSTRILGGRPQHLLPCTQASVRAPQDIWNKRACKSRPW
ncbi:hypothetical protein B0E41_12630 [Hydrogenophaga sp. A37]|nr:hypothetical protein B0E41_12630 [Hydrogenophaga sp. A37]